MPDGNTIRNTSVTPASTTLPSLLRYEGTAVDRCCGRPPLREATPMAATLWALLFPGHFTCASIHRWADSPLHIGRVPLLPP
jgi:hypothetical protein